MASAVTRRIRVASSLRRCREVLLDADAELFEIGLQEVALELSNLALKMDEAYVKLMQPFNQRPTLPSWTPLPEPGEQLPF